jgi:DNA-3-methyladenine glycosylase I
MKRCWDIADPMMIAYHDREWGVPVHDDRRHFEFMILDGFQAGLNWSIILKKRENFRRAFRGSDPAKVARFTAGDTRRLLADPGIVRNRLKIKAAIDNARRFLEVRKEFGSFDAYVWRFTGGRPILHGLKTLEDMPVTSPESDALSKDLKSRGFKFVGSTICYAYMQAAGLINDHTAGCFRYRQVQKAKAGVL